MQLAWSRSWTLVAVSIPYDDNHYTTGTSAYELFIQLLCVFYSNVYLDKVLEWQVIRS